ncbi:MAG: 6-phosphofructokinase [Elusimicrobia bacterium GWA2_69_24]|nr:MAG: 6-phosphofructokinase [Elusimicrobia bacterium GWA2_69_24]HBL17897.1 6-phosphofructokinase [Elusimicrobiota bacterium]
MTSKKVAILTGGGDCPGLNAVIRAAAKTAILEHGAEVIGIEDGFEGLVENRWRPLPYLAVSGILSQGGTILGTSNRANLFKYPLEEGGKTVFKDVSRKAVENFKAMGADVLIAIGGDGTLTVADRLRKLGVPIVGVPKTIDNDLYGTDQTFGYDTALSIATDAVDRLHSTADAHHRAMILEVMGRNAGWIALGAGLAGGGDVILIPELPYRLEAVCAYLRKRRDAGKRFSIIVIAEGAKPAGGDVVVRQRVADGAEPIRLGGVGFKLQEDIERCSGIESRSVSLGHLLRGGTPTAFDRILATRLGREAARLALSGSDGVMVGLRGSEIVPVDFKDIAGRQRLVNPDHHWVQVARSVGACFGN